MGLNGVSGCFPGTGWKRLRGRFAPRWHVILAPPGTCVLFAILCIDVAVLCLAAVSVIDAIEKKVARDNVPPAAPAVARRPVPAAKQKAFLLVDNFSNASLNCLGGRKEPFARYGAVLEGMPETEEGGGNCLRLSYDVSSPSSLCGYHSELAGVDPARFRRLRFQVKGENADEVFMVELGCGDAVRRKAVSSLLPDGLSGEWQTVSLPLPERIDGPEPLRLTFRFAHDQGMPYAGTIRVRRVRLY